MEKTIFKIVLTVIISAAVGSAFSGGYEEPPPMKFMPGLYIGLGGSWDWVKNQASAFQANADVPPVMRYSNDNYIENGNQFAPMAAFGYWSPINDKFLWGVQGNYKYLNFKTNANQVLLPNQSAPVDEAYTAVLSSTKVENEILLLAYLGVQYSDGFAYLGVGPSLFTVENTIINNSPNTVGGSTYYYNYQFPVNHTVWGWAAQLGYNYYVNPSWFLNVNYTYAQSVNQNFNSVTNRQNYFGSSTAQPTGTVLLYRKIRITVQEIMFSVNKVLAL